ncbi:MAG: DUF983 domain-containing protein [Actinobacteria bacterium]|nr:DUF983 domain-containing protein [Actinomycetota bacterium]
MSALVPPTVNPPLRTMLWRGITLRCPRCGGGRVLRSPFKLKDRCPRCDLLFEREEGFWLGAYVINFAVGEGLVGILLMVFLFVKINSPSVPLAPWILTGIALSVVLPIVFFPFSRTVWAAIDLAMNPVGESGERSRYG